MTSLQRKAFFQSREFKEEIDATVNIIKIVHREVSYKTSNNENLQMLVRTPYPHGTGMMPTNEPAFAT
jgi:hypothetical protein